VVRLLGLCGVPPYLGRGQVAPLPPNFTPNPWSVTEVRWCQYQYIDARRIRQRRWNYCLLRTYHKILRELLTLLHLDFFRMHFRGNGLHRRSDAWEIRLIRPACLYPLRWRSLKIANMRQVLSKLIENRFQMINFTFLQAICCMSFNIAMRIVMKCCNYVITVYTDKNLKIERLHKMGNGDDCIIQIIKLLQEILFIKLATWLQGRQKATNNRGVDLCLNVGGWFCEII